MPPIGGAVEEMGFCLLKIPKAVKSLAILLDSP
jgi:hypothetical protein